MTHDKSMKLIARTLTVTTLSYEEAIAIYLRSRGILKDGNEMLGAPVPDDWNPDGLTGIIREKLAAAKSAKISARSNQ